MMNKTTHDFDISGKTLEKLIELYDNGSREMYRPIAVELRKLLCDKKPLLSRVHPNFTLHKLHWTEVFEKTPSLKDGLESIMPGRLYLKNDMPNFELTFARSETLMQLEEWVSQPFLNIELTIWQLIKSVADKEGAHSDEDYDSNLIFAKQFLYYNEESHIPAIVAISKYILKRAKDLNAWDYNYS